MHPAAFADPWEHVRLLSDETRNDALIRLLKRRSPGAHVLEVGCGTGLLSCIAARCGAERVYAVEPTPLHEVASELVRINGLSNVVQVLPGMVEDHEPKPVDLAFSELLNAEPFREGVVPAMAAASRWTGTRGLLAPRRLEVYVALTQAAGAAKEVRDARRQVQGFGSAFALRVDPLVEVLGAGDPYKYLTTLEEPLSTVAKAWDLRLGEDEPDDEVVVEVEALEAGPMSGAICWFRAELDDDISMDNEPGAPTHWGQLVCAWPNEIGVRRGQRVKLHVELDGDEVEVRLA